MSATSTETKKVIHGDATKDFFVTMITRDISLRDCIFDLLDNSIDGARRTANLASNDLSQYRISISWNRSNFEIDDNCGGIRLSDAIDYAFHFGRRPDAPSEVSGGIGLYGIGMKRALFKLGRECKIASRAEDASFVVEIDVDSWLQRADWDFEYEDLAADSSIPNGTRISVNRLNSGIDDLFGDPAFENEFIRDAARDYAFFIARGLSIYVNGTLVPSYKYRLKQSESLRPYVEEYKDGPVSVRILAGLVNELDDEVPDELKPDKVDRYGWFVICNGRVVLAADKGSETIWGVDGFNVWHPQYNGFAGYLFFDSEDQSALPWTTTKRELDPSSPLYRRAISKMKEVTKEFTEYTNKRKSDPAAARAIEIDGGKIDIDSLRTQQSLSLPAVVVGSRPDLINITYKRERKEVDSLKASIGNIGMSARDVGIFTFEYYKRAEME